MVGPVSICSKGAISHLKDTLTSYRNSPGEEHMGLKVLVQTKYPVRILRWLQQGAYARHASAKPDEGLWSRATLARTVLPPLSAWRRRTGMWRWDYGLCSTRASLLSAIFVFSSKQGSEKVQLAGRGSLLRLRDLADAIVNTSQLGQRIFSLFIMFYASHLQSSADTVSRGLVVGPCITTRVHAPLSCAGCSRLAATSAPTLIGIFRAVA